MSVVSVPPESEIVSPGCVVERLPPKSPVPVKVSVTFSPWFTTSGVTLARAGGGRVVTTTVLGWLMSLPSPTMSWAT